MDAIISCIENLRMKLDRHRKDGLNEYQTRIIFVDPLLEALGWDVRDPDEVELEYLTIDRKFVDYALKINREPVLFIEAKKLNDPLTDIESITQVVDYATSAGVEWCILTNGVTYKLYYITEKAKAPENLLLEISLDPKETEDMKIQQVAGQFACLSRDAMDKGLLDKIGEQVSTTGKIRRALDIAGLAEALKRLDIAGAERYARMLYGDTDKALNEIDQPLAEVKEEEIEKERRRKERRNAALKAWIKNQFEEAHPEVYVDVSVIDSIVKIKGTVKSKYKDKFIRKDIIVEGDAEEVHVLKKEFGKKLKLNEFEYYERYLESAFPEVNVNVSVNKDRINILAKVKPKFEDEFIKNKFAIERNILTPLFIIKEDLGEILDESLREQIIEPPRSMSDIERIYGTTTEIVKRKRYKKGIREIRLWVNNRSLRREGRERERKREERRSRSAQTQTSDVKNIYLITTTDCPACKMVERELKNDIDRGLIQVLNIQESDFGADLVIKLHIMDVPKLVYEKIDGTFGIVGA